MLSRLCSGSSAESHREKNLSHILNHADTIKRLGCRLIIVGDGPERARLARANADFVGYKHGDDLVAMYRAIHFLLIPTRSDTLGLVLLEAAACGTPAVALRGTPAADLISRYESGLVVDDFDDGRVSTPSRRGEIESVQADASSRKGDGRRS